MKWLVTHWTCCSRLWILLAFKEMFLYYRAEKDRGPDLSSGLTVISLCNWSSGPQQSATRGPSSRQWDCSGLQQPSILGAASANEGRIHLGKTGSVLHLCINVKYGWVKKKKKKKRPDPPRTCFSWETLCSVTLVLLPRYTPLSGVSELSSSGAGPHPAFHLGDPAQHPRWCQHPPSPAPFDPADFAYILCPHSFWPESKFSPSAEMGFLSVWEYLCRVLLSQLPVLRFLELLLSQLVLAVGISWEMYFTHKLRVKINS